MSKPSPILSGLKLKCGNCGEGKLFKSYLKLNDACPVCGREMSNDDTADGPAFFVGFGVLILAAPFMFNDSRGAATSLYLALDPALAGISGRYFNEKQKEVAPAVAALDPDVREQLWQWSEAVCSLQESALDEASA